MLIFDKLEVTRNPYGFINKYSNSGNKIGVIRDMRGNISNSEFIKSLRDTFSPDYEIEGEISHKRYNMFPDGLQENEDSNIWYKKGLMLEAEEVFNSRYIDYDNYQVFDSSKADFQKSYIHFQT